MYSKSTLLTSRHSCLSGADPAAAEQVSAATRDLIAAFGHASVTDAASLASTANFDEALRTASSVFSAAQVNNWSKRTFVFTNQARVILFNLNCRR
jgi:hypothetical protein